MADRAADLLATASVLGYLRDVRATAAPEAQRLTERIQGLVAELVAAQNQDGGWPWVTDGECRWSEPTAGPAQRPVDLGRRSSGHSPRPSGWACSATRRSSTRRPATSASEFAGLSASDWETRAAMLHALSARRAASFEAANSLNRARGELSDSALAYLALTFANLDRPTIAGELIGLLGPAGEDRGNRARAASAAVLGPGGPPAVRAVGLRDHGAGHAGLCPGQAGRARARSGRRLAGRAPRRRGLDTASRPGDRPWPPCRRSTAGPEAPRIGTG